MVVIIRSNLTNYGVTMRFLRRLTRSLLTLPALALMVVGPPQLRADGILMTYQFTGPCSDCTGDGIGLLTLVNYTPGTALNIANFVGFSYSSNQLSLNVGSADQVSFFAGELPSLMPGAGFVDLVDTNTPMDIFVSTTDGTWCTGTYCGSDNGTDSTWDSAVPEPASIILVVSAVLVFVLFRRRLIRRA